MSLRVLLAGGGSGGSATPVLAVAQAIRRREPSVEFVYVGTREGPESELAAAQGIPFVGVHAGKLRRYWAAENLIDPFRVIVGVGEALAIARQFRPRVAFAAGGFGAVPPMVGARLAGAKCVIHQQDVAPGLANRLLAPFASEITVSLASSLAHFPRRKARLTGNPVRAEILAGDAEVAFVKLQLERSVPLVLVTGGGTGALVLNRLVAAAAPEIVPQAQIVHLTGRGRAVPAQTASKRYKAVEFLIDEMPHLLAAATVVVSRAGMGTLTELAALGKVSLVVPMPGSHQWANARAFADLGAIDVADQTSLTPEALSRRILDLLGDGGRRAELGRKLSMSMPRDAADRIASDLLEHA